MSDVPFVLNSPVLNGMARLYGQDAMARANRGRVLIVGIGGVGSWVAESLARSGVGHVTLVDADEVCQTNVNRQVHALDGTFGKAKVDAMAARMRAISPQMEVEACMSFYTPNTADKWLAEDAPVAFDVVVDAMDSLQAKAHLIARCRAIGIPVLVSGAAGGKVDPTQVQVADLARVNGDALLFALRKRLRQRYDFPRGSSKPSRPSRKWNIWSVSSPEPRRSPAPCAVADEEGPRRLDCATGYGSASYVTSVFGMFMAGETMRLLTQEKNAPADA